MNFFLVLNGRKLKRLFFMAVALCFIAGVMYVEKDNISVFSQNEPSAIFQVDTNKNVLALTFDISWGDTRAEPIIEVLQEKGVTKATFFLSSPWAQSHPDIAKKIVDAGYEIGSHGHRHENYSTLDDEDIRKQINTAHQILNKVTGITPKLIRFPNGDFDKRVLKIANEMNYSVIQWGTDSLDWKNPGVNNIVSNVVKRAKKGDIVLLHASDSSEQTHLALPEIIDQLRKQGYEFVTVSELLYQTELVENEVQDRK